MDIGKEELEKKRAIFESMSPRRRKHIEKKIGFEKWDPFQEPKDPIEIRKDKTKRTSKGLFQKFMYESEIENYSNSYGQGVLEMCIGLINDDEKVRGMYEFSVWYHRLLQNEGYSE